ncbi:MAG TPA: TonB family protein [Blastocatellia bacterium]|nr:TonB family protein [Blastocatellia bacterium]
MPLNPHTFWRARSLCQTLFTFIICAALAPALTSFAQTKWGSQELHELQIRPIYVTTRVFQIKAKRGSYEELNNQVFKMKTARLTEYENWMNAFKKTYPGFDAALLRTDSKRVFRTARPTIISMGKRPDGRDIEITINAAQSPGDGTTPGTSLIPEINIHFGNDRIKKPVAYAIQHLEVESGSTYFFSASNLKLNSDDYVGFVRPNAPAQRFDGNDIFLIFAFSVDLDTTTKPLRPFDEHQSVELQQRAAKKVQPQIPADLRDSGMVGYVRANVEISPEGKVTSANIHYSTFPEMNNEVIAAARQWEFPATLFAEDKNPITSYMTFNFNAANPASKAETQKSDKQ